MIVLDLLAIDGLIGGQLGTCDVACPECGPSRRSPVNQRRQVLRVWRSRSSAFASYHCARCGLAGHTRGASTISPDPVGLAAARAEAAERERQARTERLGKARWLWSLRRPIKSSIAETYLRGARGYSGAVLPGTLGFLPARGKHGPAMVAAFGHPLEVEPGSIKMPDDAVVGIHITRLAADGAGKAGTETDKIMIGHSIGAPIVVAPPKDLLGLVIAEGIENALSSSQVGLGAWAAGSASRLPALAQSIPDYIESITIMVDNDDDGRRHAAALAASLHERGTEVRMASASIGLRRAAA